MPKPELEHYYPNPAPALGGVPALQRYVDDELHRIGAVLQGIMSEADRYFVINDNNIDLTTAQTFEGEWIQITGNLTLPDGLNPGATFSAAAMFGNNANAAANISLGYGVDDQAPELAAFEQVLVSGGTTVIADQGVVFDTYPPGTRFALWARARRDRIGASFAGIWSYKRTNGNPGDGEVNHQDNGVEIIFDNEDKDGTDRATELATMGVDDTIAGPGQQWRVVAVTHTAARSNFDVDPPDRIASEGDYNFTFNTGIPATGSVWVLGAVYPSYLFIEA